MELFRLVGSIMVNSADAEKSIQKTGDKAEGLGKKLVSGIATAGKWAAGIGAAATAVGGAMVAAAKGTAESLDVIDKGSIRMGVTAERYQELAYAANLCGVEMGTMEKAAKKLEGTDLNFDDAINQIMSVSDETERTAKAIDIFGESIAYQMTPFLQAGADGLKDMTDEANKLGLVMSQEAVSSGAAMNDMFTKVSGSVSALKNQLMVDLMPYVMQILQWVLDNLPRMQQTVRRVLHAVMPVVQPILEMIMTALPVITELFIKLLDAVMPGIDGIVNAVKSMANGLTALLHGDLKGFAEGFLGIFKGLQEAMFAIGSNIIKALWSGLKSAWGAVGSWLGDKLSSIGSGTVAAMGQGNAHAGGLAYVPYDNYPASLHRGETVLTAQEARDYREGRNQSITINAPITISGANYRDPREFAEAISRELAVQVSRKNAVWGNA